MSSLQSVTPEVELLLREIGKRTLVMYLIAGTLTLVMFGLGVLIYIMAYFEYKKPTKFIDNLLNSTSIVECKVLERDINYKGMNSSNPNLFIELKSSTIKGKEKFWFDIQSNKSKQKAFQIVELLQPYVNKPL